MMAAATAGTPYNVCSGRAVPIRTLVELMRSKARVPIAIEQDRSRFRPNDTPLVLGDHGRLTADTGWSPRIPLAQTVEDMLSYWRRATA
jgi:GDP-4-dehydro-6-deoxy-D-mannose reductase